MIRRSFTIPPTEIRRWRLRNTSWWLGHLYEPGAGHRVWVGWYLRLGLHVHCLIRRQHAHLLENL